MNLTIFLVMGVVMGLLFVGALVAVFMLNRRDRADTLGVYRSGQPGQYYGRQEYAQGVQGHYAGQQSAAVTQQPQQHQPQPDVSAWGQPAQQAPDPGQQAYGQPQYGQQPPQYGPQS